MYLNVYVGELAEGDDPLDWGGTWNGNTPKKRGPSFPPAHVPYLREPFLQLKQRIADGVFSGKQVDWGAWAAKVSKAQILAFIAEIYGGDPTYEDPNNTPHLYEQMQKLQDYLASLAEDRLYALVGAEL